MNPGYTGSTSYCSTIPTSRPVHYQFTFNVRYYINYQILLIIKSFAGFYVYTAIKCYILMFYISSIKA